MTLQIVPKVRTFRMAPKGMVFWSVLPGVKQKLQAYGWTKQKALMHSRMYLNSEADNTLSCGMRDKE